MKNWLLNFKSIAFATLLSLFAFGYWGLSPSYKASSEAKRLYEAGYYEEAKELAQLVHEKHFYNVMAYSVLEQSNKAIKYKKFNDQAKGYLEKMESADLASIKMMCEAVVYDYQRLPNAGKLLDQKLVNDAKENYERFVQIYKELFGQSNR